MPLEVLGLAIWAAFGLAGAWLLLTGRKMIYGLPKGIREGWPLRMFGLAYLALAGFLIYQAFRGSFSPEAIVLTYFWFGVALALALNRRWKARHAEAVGPQP